MGESLLRDGSTEQAKTTLTQVRDGYKELWAQFNAAENLLNAEEDSDSAFKQWEKRKKAYNLDNPSQATQAMSIEEDAKQSQREGDFVGALDDWQAATEQWQSAYRAVSGDVASIDKKRAEDKTERQRVAKKKKVERERIAKAKADKIKAERLRLAIIKEKEEAEQRRFAQLRAQKAKEKEQRKSEYKIALNRFISLINNYSASDSGSSEICFWSPQRGNWCEDSYHSASISQSIKLSYNSKCYFEYESETSGGLVYSVDRDYSAAEISNMSVNSETYSKLYGSSGGASSSRVRLTIDAYNLGSLYFKSKYDANKAKNLALKINKMCSDM